MYLSRFMRISHAVFCGFLLCLVLLPANQAVSEEGKGSAPIQGPRRSTIRRFRPR